MVVLNHVSLFKMTSLPPHIKEQIREYAKKRNLPEADIYILEEGFCKLAEVNKRIFEQQIKEKLKKAA